MTEIKKHCDTCRYSCRVKGIYAAAMSGGSEIQRCLSPDYNSPAYTSAMLLEDWGKGHCRFWVPQGTRPETGK